MLMDNSTANKLNAINQEFYQNFSDSFNRTRNRIQPGVARIIKEIPLVGNWLDVGCGNGALALKWIGQDRKGVYHGVDFSDDLIKHARASIVGITKNPDMMVGFSVADLTDEKWTALLPLKMWDGVMMFAALHHIAGYDQRLALLKAIRQLLVPGNLFYLSVWQLRNSPRLMRREQPWSLVGVNLSDLEEGDILMDWRAKASGEPEKAGLRYIHLFSDDELLGLAEKSGFVVEYTFHSDGHEKNLGLYQCWQAVI